MKRFDSCVSCSRSGTVPVNSSSWASLRHSGPARLKQLWHRISHGTQPSRRPGHVVPWCWVDCKHRKWLCSCTHTHDHPVTIAAPASADTHHVQGHCASCPSEPKSAIVSAYSVQCALAVSAITRCSGFIRDTLNHLSQCARVTRVSAVVWDCCCVMGLLLC